MVKARDQVITWIPSVMLGLISCLRIDIGRMWNQSICVQLLLNDIPIMEEQPFMSAYSEQKLSALNATNDRFEEFF